MADFKDIQVEFKTIADAFASTSTFLYSRPEQVNWDDRTQGFPLVLLHRPHPFTYENFYDKIRIYSITISLFDLWQIAEQKTKNLDVKFSDIEDLWEKFIREFIDRSKGETVLITSKQPWRVPNPEAISVEHIYPTHSDRLVEIKGSFLLRLETDCDLGSFVY